MGRRIDVVDYDPGWPAAFAAEAGLLRTVFASSLVSIHHIGSTSVPGLAAKPVIDILVVLEDTDDMGRFDHGMDRLGYRVRGECIDAGGTPGRFYFSKPAVGERTHHVHACATGHFEIAELTLFPRYLAERPEVAAEYAALKRRVLVESSHDSAAYTARKFDWVRAAVRDALRHFGEPDRRSAALATGQTPSHHPALTGTVDSTRRSP